MMYMFIFDDFSVRYTNNPLTDDDIKNCNDGYLSIIQIGDKVPLEYIDGEWTEIPGIYPEDEEKS